MGTPFPNPVVGGGGALVIPVIRSPNFDEAAMTGWALMSNGSYYLFGGIQTGTVTVAGPGDGVFVYQGTPALGNLIVAIVSEGGTDPFGNEYSGPGISISPEGGPVNEIQIRPDLSAMLFYGS
jgi:hypothetical protein